MTVSCSAAAIAVAIRMQEIISREQREVQLRRETDSRCARLAQTAERWGGFEERACADATAAADREPQWRAHAIELRRRGVPVKTIAEALGRCSRSVYYALPAEAPR